MNEPNYYLASRFSYQSYSGGSVCMYVKSNLESSITDLSQYCIEKVIEVRAVQIKTDKHLIILLCIYRSPSGNFGEFAVQLYLILKHLQKPKLEFIMCGDFHVHFFIDSSSAQQHSF